jgi:hypothetical protein
VFIRYLVRLPLGLELEVFVRREDAERFVDHRARPVPTVVPSYKSGREENRPVAGFVVITRSGVV